MEPKNNNIFIVCKKCLIPITGKLSRIANENEKSYEDGENHIPKGLYGIVDVDYRIAFENDFVIHEEDIIKGNTKFTKNVSRLNGCCGLDGLNGLNLLCKNGHEIGTVCTDCWMPHGVVFHREFVLISK